MGSSRTSTDGRAAIARASAGPRTGWVLTLSALGGADLVLFSDVLGRLVVWPAEAPAGLVTAVVG
ncbi:iron chelate uptake ABC transporter family permease subunit, partial [Bacillus sp. S34]|nr:iron chelate uptake ABC transporter family permease subunit [Bacillus sp. S34]